MEGESSNICNLYNFESWPTDFSRPAGVMNMHFLFSPHLPNLFHSTSEQCAVDAIQTHSETMCYYHCPFAHALL